MDLSMDLFSDDDHPWDVYRFEPPAPVDSRRNLADENRRLSRQLERCRLQLQQSSPSPPTNEMEIRYHDLKESVSVVMTNLQESESRLETATMDNMAINATKHQAEANVTRLEEEIKQADDNFQQLVRKNEQLRQRLENRNRLVRQQDTELSKLRADELQKRANWIRDLGAESQIQDSLRVKLVQEHKEKKRMFDGQSKAMQYSITALQRDLNALRAENQELKMSLERQGAAMPANEDVALKRYVSTLLRERKGLTKEIKFLKQMNPSEDHSKSQGSNDEAKLAGETELSELRRAIKSLQERQKDLSLRNEKLNYANKQQESDATKLQASHTNLQAEMQRQQRCTNLVSKGKERLFRENQELKKQAKELKEQREANTVILLENHRKESNKLRADISAIQESKRLLLQEKNGLTRENEDIQKWAKQQEEQAMTKISELKFCHGKVTQKLDADLKSMKLTVEALQHDHGRVVLQKKVESDKLATDLEAQHAKNVRLQEETKQLQIKIQELHTSRCGLENTVGEMKAGALSNQKALEELKRETHQFAAKRRRTLEAQVDELTRLVETDNLFLKSPEPGDFPGRSLERHEPTSTVSNHARAMSKGALPNIVKELSRDERYEASPSKTCLALATAKLVEEDGHEDVSYSLKLTTHPKVGEVVCAKTPVADDVVATQEVQFCGIQEDRSVNSSTVPTIKLPYRRQQERSALDREDTFEVHDPTHANDGIQDGKLEDGANELDTIRVLTNGAAIEIRAQHTMESGSKSLSKLPKARRKKRPWKRKKGYIVKPIEDYFGSI